MCITAKAIFMVDFDDFGWLSWPILVGFSWPAILLESEGDEEGERKNINKKNVNR
jgi:hypothetical protein